MSEKYDKEVIATKPKMILLPPPDSPNWDTASIVIHGETVIMAKRKGFSLFSLEQTANIIYCTTTVAARLLLRTSMDV